MKDDNNVINLDEHFEFIQAMKRSDQRRKTFAWIVLVLIAASITFSVLGVILH